MLCQQGVETMRQTDNIILIFGTERTVKVDHGISVTININISASNRRHYTRHHTKFVRQMSIKVRVTMHATLTSKYIQSESEINPKSTQNLLL